MKKLFNLLLVSIFFLSGLFVLTGCTKSEPDSSNNVPTNIEKYTINASYGGEFTFEFANDLGYEVKEEKNSLIFTHNENKSTISIYTMDTATSSIIMKEKDFSSSAYSGYKKIEINGHEAFTITKNDNYAITYGIQLDKDERDSNTNYKYYGVKIVVSKNALKLDEFDPTSFVQTEEFQHFLNSIKVTPATVEK